ncbi:MAG: flippase-like domain-containing protein [Deltaproteobacteria bacterium]|nr:flippase-like domain-containing protein [Deltaproteobacteria bacterium]
MKKQVRWNLLLSGIASLILIFLLVGYVPQGELVRTFKSFSTESLFFYALCSLLAVMIRAWRYRALLSSMDTGEVRIPFYGMVLVTGIRNAFVDFLPARLGEIAYFLALKRLGINLLTAGSSWALCIALDLVVLAGITFVLFSFFLSGRFSDDNVALHTAISEMFFGGESQREMVLFCVIVAVIALFVVFLRFASPIIRSVVAFIRREFPTDPSRKIGRAVNLAVDAGDHVARDIDGVKRSGRLTQIVLLTVALRVLKYGALYVLLLGLLRGLDLKVDFIHPFIAFTAFLFAESSASLPASGLMGFGTYEAIWTLVFSLSHVEIESSQVLAIGFSIHVVTQIVGYTIGLLSVALLASYSREKPQG